MSRFDRIQRFISHAKILLVEIAGTIGLIVLIYHGLKLEMKW